MSGGPQVTVVIPIVDRVDDIAAVYREYRSALDGMTGEVEFLFIFDGPNKTLEAKTAELEAADDNVRSIILPYHYGEATCLRTGERHARGAVLLVLPPYRQITANAIPSLLLELKGADLVSVARDRRNDSLRHRLRANLLRAMSRIAGSERDDLGCAVRLFRRGLLSEIDLRGEQHRFLAVIAERAGFTVRRVVLPQADEDRRAHWHGPTHYVGRVLDVVSIAFLLRFTQKPFRFFGPIGASLATIGFILAAVLAGQKLLYGMSLADRPALLLSVLLIVLGIQIGAIGLIAEMLVMTRHRDLPTYRIDRIVGGADAPMQPTRARKPAA